MWPVEAWIGIFVYFCQASLCHDSLADLLSSGHLTESVVVQSLGELLPETSQEVRRKRLCPGHFGRSFFLEADGVDGGWRRKEASGILVSRGSG